MFLVKKKRPLTLTTHRDEGTGSMVSMNPWRPWGSVSKRKRRMKSPTSPSPPMKSCRARHGVKGAVTHPTLCVVIQRPGF